MSATRQSFLTFTRSSTAVVSVPRLTNLTVARALPGAVSVTAISKSEMSHSWASTNGSKVLDHQRGKRRLEIAPDRAFGIERMAGGIVALIATIDGRHESERRHIGGRSPG